MLHPNNKVKKHTLLENVFFFLYAEIIIKINDRRFIYKIEHWKLIVQMDFPLSL